jgi:hypothetical protein
MSQDLHPEITLLCCEYICYQFKPAEPRVVIERKCKWISYTAYNSATYRCHKGKCLVSYRYYKTCEDVAFGLMVVETGLLGLALVLKLFSLTSLH